MTFDRRRYTKHIGTAARISALAAFSLATACSDSEASSEGAEENGTTQGTSEDPGPAWAACSTVREELLAQVDRVSEGAVSVVTETGETRVLYVDASAGGFQAAAENAATYVNLERAERVDVTDFEADSSRDWDLAIKRILIRTNGGDSGVGEGASEIFAAEFDEVTSADIDAAALAPDWFLDHETCEATVDPALGGIVTPLSDWYQYEEGTMIVTPKPAVLVVQSADGERLYKLSILDYYADPTGETGLVSGRYLVEYSEL